MKRLLACLFLTSAIVTPEIRYFRFERPVEVLPNTQGQACAVVDPQIFPHAAAGLSDLRLYRGTDETPYIVHGSRPTPSPQPTILPMNLGTRQGKTVFDAAMPEAEYTDVQLNLAGQNFLATVAVTGSQTIAGTPTRIGAYTIFDFASQRLGRSTLLHLPRSNYPYLHFEITGPIAPDHVLSLSATAAPASEPKYLTIVHAGPLARKGRTSVAEFNVPINVPVDRILFSPPAQPVNFSRQVSVQAVETKTDGNRPPRPFSVASGDLLRMHRVQLGHPIDEERLAIDAAQPGFSTAATWTITIENGDDLPVAFSDVQVQMVERDLCFEAAAAGSYALYYGDKALSTPRYDYAAWFAQQPNATVAVLGAEQANPVFQERPDTRPFTERHPALLWVALIVVILLLGIVALRTAQRVPDSPR